MAKAKKLVLVVAVTAAMVDELGELKAAIAKLEEREKAIVANIKAAGMGRYNGELFDAVAFEAEKENVDWKAIANKVGYSPQLKAAHTKKAVTKTVKVTARTGELAKAA